MELNPAEAARLRVLVADDDADVRSLIVSVLAEFDAEVEVAADGGEAWSLFEEWRPDLVLLDVDMPIVDGIEVCKRIRELDEDHEAFIVFLAERDHPETLDTLLDAGGDEFIAKPMTAEDLRARLIVSRRRIALYADKRRAEVELVDARRLSAIGETTLSLQHEINNPLSALLGNAELLMMEMREKGESNELLTVIHEQAMRIADVVRRLRRLENPESVDYVGGTKIIKFWKERAS
jgi:DNA-binding response OmpR family regulator